MLHILLLILKIIGITLGVLLGMILLCLILALFVPIRYRADAKRTEREGAPPAEVRAKVTWLLHIVNIRLDYAAELRVRARIFFFTLFRLPKKPQKSGKEAGGQPDNEEKKAAGKQSGAKVREAKKQEAGIQEAVKTKADAESEEARKDAYKYKEDAQKEDTEEPDTGKTPKIPVKERIVKGIIKIYRILKNIWYTIIGICDKIKKIRENIEYYVQVVQSNMFRKSFALCKEELAAIFSDIRPRKFQADLIIGTDDPASTAQILSYYGLLYPIIGGSVNITPDFDRKRIEGFVRIRGKITLFTFIKAAVHVYFSKDIRRLLKLLKKEEDV